MSTYFLILYNIIVELLVVYVFVPQTIFYIVKDSKINKQTEYIAIVIMYSNNSLVLDSYAVLTSCSVIYSPKNIVDVDAFMTTVKEYLRENKFL